MWNKTKQNKTLTEPSRRGQPRRGYFSHPRSQYRVTKYYVRIYKREGKGNRKERWTFLSFSSNSIFSSSLCALTGVGDKDFISARIFWWTIFGISWRSSNFFQQKEKNVQCFECLKQCAWRVKRITLFLEFMVSTRAKMIIIIILKYLCIFAESERVEQTWHMLQDFTHFLGPNKWKGVDDTLQSFEAHPSKLLVLHELLESRRESWVLIDPVLNVNWCPLLEGWFIIIMIIFFFWSCLLPSLFYFENFVLVFVFSIYRFIYLLMIDGSVGTYFLGVLHSSCWKESEEKREGKKRIGGGFFFFFLKVNGKRKKKKEKRKKKKDENKKFEKKKGEREERDWNEITCFHFLELKTFFFFFFSFWNLPLLSEIGD